MSDKPDTVPPESGNQLPESRKARLQKLQDELEQGKLSRRGFLNRLSALGVGFGAAHVLGVRDAGAYANLARDVQLGSTDPALNDILSEGKLGPQADADDAEESDPPVQLVQYRRFYPRGYFRYARIYPRYARIYPRFYPRYARFLR
jgi:hypothetical protein